MGHSKRFTYQQGTTFNRSVDVNGSTADVPYDLTGTTIWFVVKQDEDDADEGAPLWLYWENGSGVGISVASPTSGVLSISRTPAQMVALTPGLYYWYLRLRDATSVIYTIDTGILDVIPGPVAVNPPA